MSDLIKREDAIKVISDRICDNKWVCECAINSLPTSEAEDRHYIKIYADDEPSVKAEKLYQICDETQNREVAEWLKEYFPSTNDNWIPVSERLPSKDGRYLVFYEGPIIGSSIEIMWYSEPLMPNVDVSGKHFYRSDSEWGDIIYDEVIAWMPLPTPYKESEVEE